MARDKKDLLRQKLITSRRNLERLLQRLDSQQWETVVYTEGSEWRVADVLGHLTDAERGMTRLIENVCRGGEGAPPDFDLARWNARVVDKAKSKSSAELQVEMEQNRVRLLQVLDNLKEEDWQKKGRHASLRIMSVEEILNLIADHERQHTQDIRAALGSTSGK